MVLTKASIPRYLLGAFLSLQARCTSSIRAFTDDAQLLGGGCGARRGG